MIVELEGEVDADEVIAMAIDEDEDEADAAGAMHGVLMESDFGALAAHPTTTIHASIPHRPPRTARCYFDPCDARTDGSAVV